ncbi:MAG TPA: hypothetical protein VFA58_05710 [Chthoniobacterales bacterium]|nr:hypothetical protein [Chthoniobacterales bacterium]
MQPFPRNSYALTVRFLTLIGCLLFTHGTLRPVPCYADSAARKTAQVEYIAPDGQFSSLRTTDAATHEPSAAFIDRDTISCALREGETTFIIELPKNSSSDRFTFLNENAAACGELRIAVSDSALPADSPKWNEVDGIVPFAHKRLFKLSILGVETKFVRLSFTVVAASRNTARISDPFRASLVAAGIDSNFPTRHQKSLDLSLSTSVGALWAR